MELVLRLAACLLAICAAGVHVRRGDWERGFGVYALLAVGFAWLAYAAPRGPASASPVGAIILTAMLGEAIVLYRTRRGVDNRRSMR